MVSPNRRCDKRSLGLQCSWIKQCRWQFVSSQHLALPSSGFRSVDCPSVVTPESSEFTCPSSNLSVKERSSSPRSQQKSQNWFSLAQLGCYPHLEPISVATGDGLC